MARAVPCEIFHVGPSPNLSGTGVFRSTVVSRSQITLMTNVSKSLNFSRRFQMYISTRHHSFWAVKTVSISDQKSFTIRWPYKERFYCITFQLSLTYLLRRRTTFCWCARCGRGVAWSSGGRHPYRSASPDTCWRRYERLPEPLTTAVPVRLTPDVCIVETRLREPSYVPNHRYGSLDLGGKIQKIKLLTKQECIPVGCVPPVCWPYPVVRGGVSVQPHPWMQTPLVTWPVMHVGTPNPLSPCGQKEWQMLVKTLPCPNFVCGR